MAKGMQLQAMPQGGGIKIAHASNGLCCTCTLKNHGLVTFKNYPSKAVNMRVHSLLCSQPLKV
jgi:hypothetical protein